MCFMLALFGSDVASSWRRVWALCCFIWALGGLYLGFMLV